MDKDNWRDREKKSDKQESRQLERDLGPIERGGGVEGKETRLQQNSLRLLQVQLT